MRPDSFSELCTSRWIKENSSVCELTGYPVEKITKDQLYRISLKLYEEKSKLECYLSHRTNELFDMEDKIILYDLTDTCFEGLWYTAGQRNSDGRKKSGMTPN
jgi:hypothetical protein